MKKANRRKSARKKSCSVWVTETSGDFVFVSPLGDISEGGVFLKKRVITNFDKSVLNIHFKKKSFQVEAQPLYDRVDQKEYGTGYCFLNLSKMKSIELKKILKSLN